MLECQWGWEWRDHDPQASEISRLLSFCEQPDLGWRPSSFECEGTSESVILGEACPTLETCGIESLHEMLACRMLLDGSCPALGPAATKQFFLLFCRERWLSIDVRSHFGSRLPERAPEPPVWAG
eukprot:6436601-Amphidinium_carterae.1